MLCLRGSYLCLSGLLFQVSTKPVLDLVEIINMRFFERKEKRVCTAYIQFTQRKLCFMNQIDCLKPQKGASSCFSAKN